MVRTKVFVGNLDFQTKEAELVKEFGAAGKVISANIITRGPRSLGYGFVEMESEEDATKACSMLNKKEIDGRPVNVEVARPRDESAEANKSENSPRGTRGGRGNSRGGSRGRGSRGRGSRGGFSRGPSSFRPRGSEGSPRQTSPREPREPRPPREPRGEENRTPSKTMLFVANLPFKLDDEGFAKVFKDATLNYKSAHVVRNQRSGRSKGFGFVEFENEADQQKALNTVNKMVVDERELSVKVALTEQTKPVETAPVKQ